MESPKRRNSPQGENPMVLGNQTRYKSKNHQGGIWKKKREGLPLGVFLFGKLKKKEEHGYYSYPRRPLKEDGKGKIHG